jgi:hypothetical protein
MGHIYAIRVGGDGSLDTAWPVDGLPVYTASPIFAGGFAVTSDGVGGGYVAWEDLRAGSRDIRMQHVLGTGGFAAGWPSDGVPVCTAPGDQWAPKLVPDGVGGVFVSWSDFRGVGGRVYVQHLDTSGMPATGWAENGITADRIGVPGYEVGNVAMEDKSGGVYLAWVDGDGSGTNGRVTVQHVRQDGTIAPGWALDGLVIASGAGHRYALSICDDGLGGAFLAWSDTRTPSALNKPDVFVSRVAPSGALAPGWPANGLAVCLNPAGQWGPQIAPDGSGGAYVAWSDERDFAATGSHVFAAHVGAEGLLSVGWPSDGLHVSRAESDQRLTSLIPDGDGGCLAFWGDYSYGAYNVVALRLTPEGPAYSAFLLASVDVTQEQIRIRWSTPSGATASPTVERYSDRLGWRELGVLTPDGSGFIEYVDQDVIPGERYLYRLVLVENGITKYFGATWAMVPLEVRMRGPFPNPASGMPSFEVTLKGNEPARLELFDVAGRLVWFVDLTAKGAGTHVVRPESQRHLPAGLYIARLVSGGQSSTVRAMVLH